jgi:hypothetical protein
LDFWFENKNHLATLVSLLRARSDLPVFAVVDNFKAVRLQGQ